MSFELMLNFSANCSHISLLKYLYLYVAIKHHAFPVEEVSPIKTFYAAVARKDSEQFPEDGYLSENKLSRMEALKGMTIWGAYANFEEDEKGSIEVGKNADFIMLDRDIIKVSERRILKARIVATILNGNVVYSNRFR